MSISKSTRRGLQVLVAFLGGMALGGLIATRGRHQIHDAQFSTEEASVNDEKILGPEFYYAMRLASGPAVLQRLVEEKVIFQEAKKQNLSISDDEIKEQMSAIDQQTNELGVKKVLKDEICSNLLLKKMILKDVTDAQKHQVYDHFKDEFVQYELFDILIANKEDADNTAAALKKGDKFETLASTSSLDRRTKSQGGRMGFQTYPAIRDVLGAEIAEAVSDLKAGQASSPLETQGGGYLILKLGKVRSSYDDLKDSVEDVLIKAGQPTLMYRLLSTAKIISPKYLPAPSQASGPGLPGPGKTPSSAVTPGNINPNPVFQQPQIVPNLAPPAVATPAFNVPK